MHDKALRLLRSTPQHCTLRSSSPCTGKVRAAKHLALRILVDNFVFESCIASALYFVGSMYMYVSFLRSTKRRVKDA